MEQPHQVYEGLLKYIASLSDEEREKYKDLIEEALQRDRVVARHSIEGRRNAERFAESIQCFMETARDLHAGISMINEKLLDIQEASEMISKRLIYTGPSLN